MGDMGWGMFDGEGYLNLAASWEKERIMGRWDENVEKIFPWGGHGESGPLQSKGAMKIVLYSFQSIKINLKDISLDNILPRDPLPFRLLRETLLSFI